MEEIGTATGASLLSFAVCTMTYFDKYRATATAIKYAGWSSSGMAGPLVLSAIAANYGLCGNLLLAAGFTMHSIPLVMLLRDPRPFRLHCAMRAMHTRNEPEAKRKSTSGNLESDFKDHCKNPPSLEGSTCQKSSTSSQRSNISTIATVDKSSAGNCDAIVNWSSQSSTFTGGTSAGIRKWHKTPPHIGALETDGSCSIQNKGSLVLTDRPKATTEAEAPTSILAGLAQFTLFREPAFYVLFVSYALCDYAVPMHATTVVDYAVDKGRRLEEAKLVLTYNAAGQFVGRTALPLASDFLASSRCTIAVACFVGAAVYLAIMPTTTSFFAYATLNVALGVSQGYAACIRPVLATDYLGIERVPAFFGLLGLTMVPACLSGPAIVGFFRDTLCSYDNFYRLLGPLNFCVAGLLSVLVWRDRSRRGVCNIRSASVPEDVERSTHSSWSLHCMT